MHNLQLSAFQPDSKEWGRNDSLSQIKQSWGEKYRAMCTWNRRSQKETASFWLVMDLFRRPVWAIEIVGRDSSAPPGDAAGAIWNFISHLVAAGLRWDLGVKKKKKGELSQKFIWTGEMQGSRPLRCTTGSFWKSFLKYVTIIQGSNKQNPLICVF